MQPLLQGNGRTWSAHVYDGKCVKFVVGDQELWVSATFEAAAVKDVESKLFVLTRQHNAALASVAQQTLEAQFEWWHGADEGGDASS